MTLTSQSLDYVIEPQISDAAPKICPFGNQHHRPSYPARQSARFRRSQNGSNIRKKSRRSEQKLRRWDITVQYVYVGVVRQ